MQSFVPQAISAFARDESARSNRSAEVSPVRIAVFTSMSARRSPWSYAERAAVFLYHLPHEALEPDLARPPQLGPRFGAVALEQVHLGRPEQVRIGYDVLAVIEPHVVEGQLHKLPNRMRLAG